MTSTLLEEARSGNPSAIASIINRSLQKKNISAAVDVDNGNLHIMLDAKQIIHESAAEYIFNGISKLNIENTYDVYVYGRKIGEPFATWCHEYKLRDRPFNFVSSSNSTTQNNHNKPESGITIHLSGINGDKLNLDIVPIIGLIGVAITIFGILSPVINLPIVGAVNYFKNGSEEAIVLIFLMALSAFFLIKRYYSWLWGSSLWAFLTVTVTFWLYQKVITDTKTSVNRDFEDNPFRGIADAAMAATGLSWGWYFLFLGTGLVVLAVYFGNRKPDKQAAISLLIIPIVALGIAVLKVPYSRYSELENSNLATESVAKINVGIINRSQQLHQLDKSAFAKKIEDLELSTDLESNNYKYKIVVSDDDITAVTATARKRGLKSFIGAVSLVEDDDGFSTTEIILCESEKPSKSPPSLPSTTSDGVLQCASGSNSD